MTCALCGAARTHDAHVRSRSDFANGEDDVTGNIIPLCPTCHADFDEEPGLVGIDPDKRHFIVIDQGGLVLKKESKVSIIHLADGYVEWKNQHCKLAIQLALGIVPGYEHYRL